MVGKVTNPANENLKDLSGREIVVMLPLLLFVFWIGLYPNTFFEKMNPSLENLIDQVKAKQQVVMVIEDGEQSAVKVAVNE